ncbi:helix-turn-helix domain-containing protein [Mycolicibacterium boenickei]|uniref:Helix-turn-helix domain-containing protein n=1 Tax=Mycolicibacterium boenickei TaxID=146017 RepID=A0AAX2ZW30_9MYCO|nr:helix-turn-helix domain-containing protein [Mycolicibacterium boenickei]PEG59757.1 DNA-binding protein [Mycolicibacterium boenickei]UNB99368.1 helix-turn-helix domain-containing protein [Mycolicibacterium boenickei]BBX89003.1 hypothetical protein MBOE_06520 [Mycolicibacterium boenickei]
MELLGTRAASSLLGIPEATLRYWRHTDEGPPSFKLGGRVVYRRNELERWVEEQEAATVRGGRAAV